MNDDIFLSCHLFRVIKQHIIFNDESHWIIWSTSLSRKCYCQLNRPTFEKCKPGLAPFFTCYFLSLSFLISNLHHFRTVKKMKRESFTFLQVFTFKKSSLETVQVNRREREQSRRNETNRTEQNRTEWRRRDNKTGAALFTFFENKLLLLVVIAALFIVCCFEFKNELWEWRNSRNIQQAAC